MRRLRFGASGAFAQTSRCTTDAEFEEIYSETMPIFWNCSDPNAYVVRFWIENPFLGAALTETDPPGYKIPTAEGKARFFERRQDGLESIGETLTYTTKYGLNLIYRESDLTHPRGTFYYTNTATDERQHYFACDTDMNIKPYQTCKAIVYWPDGLGLEIRFLKEAMPEWEAIIETAHDLAISWRANAESEAN